MRTIKNLKRLLIGASALGLIGCAPEVESYHSFDMTALSPWQRELFVLGGREPWNWYVEHNPKSENDIHFANFLEGGRAAEIRHLQEGVSKDVFGNKYGGRKFVEIVLLRDVGKPWQDCRTENGGADFLKASRYLIGQLIGNETSDDPNSAMYPVIQYCGSQ